MKALRLAAAQRFEWIDLAEPASPKNGEALVSIRAIGICGTDVSGYLGKMPFIQFPRILGHELGVEVIAVGDGVTNVQRGDRCSVEPYINCGPTSYASHRGRPELLRDGSQVLGVHTRRRHETASLLRPRSQAPPSAAISRFEQLALVETLAIGCHAVNRAAVAPHEDVLIIGAGPIGLSVLEFARLATDRVAVLELNESRREFVRRHYPDVILMKHTPPECIAQIVFDATGSPASMSETLRHAKFTGRIVFVGITKEPVTIDDPLLHRRELTLLASRNAVAADFTRIISLIESGRIDTQPWISHRARFENVPDAFTTWIQPQSGVIKAMVEM